MKIKIVFFMANLMGGGAERVTTNIIKQLNKEYFEITLILVSKKGIFLNEIPNHVNVISLNSKKTIYSLFKLRSIIKELKTDILYSTMESTNIVQYLALLNFKNRPSIILRHPISPKVYFSQKNGLRVLFNKILLKKVYSASTKVVAQTPEMKEELNQYYNTPLNKIDVFFNPLDKIGIEEKIKNISNPFNQKDINVVASGRISEQKAFDILLDAFKLVIKKNANFKLYIIGRDDGEKDALIKKRAELKLEKYVRFLGFQENPYRFYYFSDLFVLSSRREGLPNTVLENLYLKKPIVSTECIPFMSTLIKNGKNGFLVPIEDSQALSMAILNFKKLTKYGFINSQQPANPNDFFKKYKIL